MNSILLDILRAIRSNAYVPDSHFPLSALAISDKDFIVAGVNWESTDRSIGACGETAAILNMVSCNGPSSLKRVVMMGGNEGEDDKDKTYSSCSACRQFMLELDESGESDVTTYSINGNVSETQAVQSMMPSPFVFSNYISSPIKSSYSSNKIVPAPLKLRGFDLLENEDEGWFHQEVINAAYRSFSPDESYFQGAIIVAENGAAYCGSLFQAANFKSSKDAITSALSMMISFDGIQNVKEVHFLHIENRPFAKAEKQKFPLNMMNVLQSIGVQKIFIHNETGIEREIRLPECLSSFCNEPTGVVALPMKVPFEVPLEYRGSVQILV